MQQVYSTREVIIINIQRYYICRVLSTLFSVLMHLNTLKFFILTDIATNMSVNKDHPSENFYYLVT